jgi:hypothetical protein
MTNLDLDEDYFNELEAKDILIITDQDQIPDKGGDGVRDTWRDYVGEWTNLNPPFYWLTYNHLKINWMSSV